MAKRDFIVHNPYNPRSGIRVTDEGSQPVVITDSPDDVPEGADPDSCEHVELRRVGPYLSKVRSEGPARVTSPQYRAGWDRIFGGRQEVGQA